MLPTSPYTKPGPRPGDEDDEDASDEDASDGDRIDVSDGDASDSCV